MAVWQLTPAAYLLDPIERAEKAGFDLDALFGEIGVNREHFVQPGATVTRENYYRIIDYLLHDLGVPDVGFVQPENEHLLNVGAVGLAAMTAETVGDSLRTAIRFQHLFAVPTRLSLENRRDATLLVFDTLDPGESRDWLLRWSVETSASSFAVFLKGYPESLRSARFEYPEPDNRDTYEKAFACDLLFDQPRSELEFPRLLLQRPLPTSNRLVHEVAARQCEQTDHLARPTAELVDRIRSLLMASMSYSLQVDEVALRLGMSTRTLQRRLGEEGTSFRNIARQTKCQFARELLRTDLSVKEVAYLTGYSEVANFSAAFKAETSVSPSRYGLRHANEK